MTPSTELDELAELDDGAVDVGLDDDEPIGNWPGFTGGRLTLPSFIPGCGGVMPGFPGG
jgi:hypothetical protein